MARTVDMDRLPAAAPAPAGHTGDNPEDCQICWIPFDDALYRPRTLPCGHTLCSVCIDRLKQHANIICPTCRARHDVPEGGQFPVNYAMENLIKRLKDTEAAAAAAAGAGAFLPHRVGVREGTTTQGGQNVATGNSQRQHLQLLDQQNKVLAAINTCQELQTQLGQYQTSLVGWCEQQARLEDSMQHIINQSRSARFLMRQEESKAAAKKEEVKEVQQQLNTKLEALRRVTPTSAALPDINNSDHYISKAEQRAEECQGMFPNVATAATAKKAMVALTVALKAAESVPVAQENVAVRAGEPQHQPGPARTMTERLRNLLNNSPTLKAADLRRLTQPTRRLLEAGHLFAVHQVAGRWRSAKITSVGGRLFLHTLQDPPPPLGATTLQVREIVPPSPTCLVFLDLNWPESMPRRVLIRVNCDIPMGRQFVLLCTGQHGPSYANTRFFRVLGRGQPGERVMGGDYERNTGEGGAAVVPDLDLGEFRKSGRAGSVFGMWGDPARGALFGISTRDVQLGGPFPGVFGEVVEGLGGVVAAVQHRYITEVTVVDCGVVLFEF